MFRMTQDKMTNTVSYAGDVTVQTDKVIGRDVVREIIDKIATRYVTENYDDVVKLIDIDAFKANLTIALTVQAAQKAKDSF